MKKTILTLLAASLITVSAAPIASAAERHHVRKVVRAPVSEQIRNANDFAVWGPRYDSSYVDGHAISAPAGR
jgi:hypothetical protein